MVFQILNEIGKCIIFIMLYNVHCIIVDLFYDGEWILRITKRIKYEIK